MAASRFPIPSARRAPPPLPGRSRPCQPAGPRALTSCFGSGHLRNQDGDSQVPGWRRRAAASGEGRGGGGDRGEGGGSGGARRGAGSPRARRKDPPPASAVASAPRAAAPLERTGRGVRRGSGAAAMERTAASPASPLGRREGTPLPPCPALGKSCSLRPRCLYGSLFVSLLPEDLKKNKWRIIKNESEKRG